MLYYLICAWFLTLFRLDVILTSAVNELLGTNYTTNVYWLAVVVFAVIFEIIDGIKRKKE